jgi:hypothetical protein
MDGRAFDTLSPDAVAKELHVLPPSDGAMLPRSFNQGNVGARTWSASNLFTTATFRFYLAHDDARKVKVEVLNAAGEVQFSQEVEAKAGYHEVAWQGGGRGGFGGGFAGMGGGRGGRGGGTRPGQFAVKVTLGDQSEVMAFRIRDLRGPRSPFGGTPGIGAEGGEEQSALEHGEEAEERANEGEGESEREGERGGR